MPEEEEEKPREFKVVLGISTMPMVYSTFSLPDGTNPFTDALLETCTRVLDETAQKLLDTASQLCAKNGFQFESMDPITQREMVRQACNKDIAVTETQTFQGVMQDGKPILDDDLAKAFREGQSTKN